MAKTNRSGLLASGPVSSADLAEKYSLPVRHGYSETFECLAYWCKANAIPAIFGMVKETARTGQEVAVNVWSDGQTVSVGETTWGDEESVRGAAPFPAGSDVGLALHTHPIGPSGLLSANDLRSAVEYVLTDGRERPDEARGHGTVVTSETGQITVYVVEATETGQSLSATEVAEVKERLFADVQECAALPLVDESPYLSGEGVTFKAPSEPVKLGMRAALPDSLSGEAIGRAYSRGELAALLGEDVEYVTEW